MAGVEGKSANYPEGRQLSRTGLEQGQARQANRLSTACAKRLKGDAQFFGRHLCLHAVNARSHRAGLDDATTRFGRVKRAEPVLSPHNVIAIEPPTLGRSVALTQAVEQIFKMILRRTL